MGRGIIICRVNGKKFREGTKSRLRFPAMTSGSITQTFCSKTAAQAAKKNLPNTQRNRAKITKA